MSQSEEYKTFLDRARDLALDQTAIEANREEVAALCLIDIAQSLREIQGALIGIAGSVDQGVPR